MAWLANREIGRPISQQSSGQILINSRHFFTLITDAVTAAVVTQSSSERGLLTCAGRQCTTNTKPIQFRRTCCWALSAMCRRNARQSGSHNARFPLREKKHGFNFQKWSKTQKKRQLRQIRHGSDNGQRVRWSQVLRRKMSASYWLVCLRWHVKHVLFGMSAASYRYTCYWNSWRMTHRKLITQEQNEYFNRLIWNRIIADVHRLVVIAEPADLRALEIGHSIWWNHVMLTS